MVSAKTIRKSVFGEDERWTEEASALLRELVCALQPVVKQWVVEKGYKIREIEHVASCAVTEVGLDLLLDPKMGVGRDE